MVNVKWINKFSAETGYVKKVLKSKGHFENTFAKEEAKKYRSEKMAVSDIDALTAMGEADNNIFEVESL